jgi:hypothetical protein
MPPDPTRIADTKAWLTKVVHDLRRGDILLGVEPPDVEGGLFHCQQAAEKRSRLSSHGTMFPFAASTNSMSLAVTALTLTLR